MKLVINFFYPCFILDVVPGNSALASGGSALWTMGIGFGIVALGFGLAWLAACASRMKKGGGRRTFTISAGVQNYGYLPLPIIAELFPAKSDTLQGLTVVHGLGVEIAMWTVGVSILASRANWRLLINGPLIATLVALILNFTGLHAHIPNVLTTFFEMAGACALPVAIFMIGATMARFFDLQAFRKIDGLRVGAVSVVVRLGLLGALLIAVAIWLPISHDLKTVIVIQAAMPAAIFPIVLARLYDGHPATAVQVVLATSLVSIITAPLVIALGLRWLG